MVVNLSPPQCDNENWLYLQLSITPQGLFLKKSSRFNYKIKIPKPQTKTTKQNKKTLKQQIKQQMQLKNLPKPKKIQQMQLKK